MKLYKGIFCSVAVAALLSGCAKEDPFVDYTEYTGTLMTRCLAPQLTDADGVDASTRAEIPSTDDFNVVITRQNAARDVSGAGTVEYKYSEMPEVLTLPVGDYKVYAHHGNNSSAAWDEPYYYGESSFGIYANKITDDVDPIVAKLSNIRVTIVFHPSLLSAMSPDSKVEVKAGTQGALIFAPEESRSAYFKYVNKSQTLAATFTGTVDGTEVVQTQTYHNVAPGNHYRITFRVHGIDDDDPGIVEASVTVDTTVENVNMTQAVDGEKEEYLPDDMRPTQNGKEDPDDPKTDDKVPPVITSATPTEAGLVPVNLDALNEVTENTYCVLNVVSSAEGGIEEFTVDIDSDTLTGERLEDVGLAAHLDLVNPGSLEAPMQGLGFPVNVGGMKTVSFNITSFMPMLGALGEGTHNFILKVKDANGETTKTLRLHTN